MSKKFWQMSLSRVGGLYQIQSRIICTSRILSGWKNFNLDDELTQEVKHSIEKKWSSRVYGVACPAEKAKQLNKPNKQSVRYILPMFPYPSGRLHLGHVRVYTLSDVLARFHRLQGHTVIHPMGWDAFGLPAENAAREHGVDAKEWTRENIEFMRKQILDMGCCFDWDREFETCDPSYYKWTQWLFVQLWKKGLAYKKRAYVFWDPVDKTVLAEEQVDPNMRSWRSGAKVEKKLLNQWFIKTAVFAQKLSEGLKSGDLKHGWRDVVSLQDHWIGNIKGWFTDCVVDLKDILEIDSSESSSEEPLRLWFSDRNALSKARFVILSPEHFLSKASNAVREVLPGGYMLLKFCVKNPVTGDSLPVFTGPADKLPWIPESCDCRTDEKLELEEYPDATESEDFLANIEQVATSHISAPNTTTSKEFECHPSSLKLRDWLISRQRKWGTPIPAINCNDCGKSSILEQLPVLPSLLYTSTPPKCSHCGSEKVNKETDTLDTFFDSSWYFLRFLDPSNDAEIFEQRKVENSLPVHTYIGGKEHATLHLYYARFMTQFLHALGLLNVTEPFQKLIPIGMVLGEAYIMKGSGQYLKKEDCEQGEDKKFVFKEAKQPVYTKWEKMSKSKFNGIDPSTVLEQYGIDVTRLLTMAEAAPTSPRKWPPNNAEAYIKFQQKIWLLLRQFVDAKDFGEIAFIDSEVWEKSEIEIFDARNFYLKGINHDYSDTSQISVVISKLQALFGSLRKVPKVYMKESIEFERAFGAAIICLYPIMPAYSAQLWQSFRDVANFCEPEFNLDYEVWEQPWPSVDYRYALDLVCKLKGEEFVAKVERNYLDTMDEATALQIVLDLPEVQKLIQPGQFEVVRYIVEPGFRATIHIRDTSYPTPTDKNKTSDNDQSTSSKKDLEV